MPLWKNLAEDVRNWGVNSVMTMLVAGLIFLFAPIFAAILKAIRSEPVAWYGLFAASLIGLALVSIAVVALTKAKRPVVVSEDQLGEIQKRRAELLARDSAKKPPSVENEIRSSICSKIDEFIPYGDELLNRMLPLGSMSVHGDFNAWSTRCEEYLKDSIGEIAVRLFRTPVPVPYNPFMGGVTSIGGQWNHDRQLYERIFSRVARLRDISTKVENGELVPG
jgi:hypothetical protein